MEVASGNSGKRGCDLFLCRLSTIASMDLMNKGKEKKGTEDNVSQSIDRKL